MNTNRVVEEPIFSIYSSSYNGRGETVDVFASDLRWADVGATWSAEDTGSCGRDCHCESLKIVYKNSDGCAVLHRVWGTTDSPDPEDWESDPDLIWVELH